MNHASIENTNSIIVEIGTGYTSIPSKIGAATEIVVEDITRSLQKINREVIIFDIPDKERLPSNLPIHEVKIPSFIADKVGYNLGVFHKLKRVFYSFSLVYSLSKFIKKDISYILHFHNQYNFFFFWLFTTKNKRKNTSLFYTTHSSIWIKPWNEIKDKIRIKYYMESFAMRHADASYVLNENSYYNILNYLSVPSNKLHLIPNGVNTDIYKPLDKNDSNLLQLKEKLGLENKKVLFLAGTVEERKNQLQVIKDLTPFFKENPDVVFLYAGGVRDKKYFDAIEKYIKDEDIAAQVKYLGEISPGKTLNLYYNLSDAFIFASTFEAFGLVIIEALSAGIPAILTENLLIHFFKEENAGIFTYSSQTDLYKIIRNEIFKKENQIRNAENARLFIEKNFSWDKVTQKYFN